MIKIAFVIDSICTHTGGTEKQLLLLLKNLDRNKFDPTLCVLRTSEWVEKDFDICPVYIVGIDSFKNFKSWLKLLQLSLFLAKNRFDIVQTHFVDGNKIGVLAAKLAGVKRIVSTRRNQGYWLNEREAFILRILNRWTHHYIANSFSTREWSSRVEKIPVEKISVIYNALDLEPACAPAERIRESSRSSLGLPLHAFVAGIVANLRPVKCIDQFIKAAREVKNVCSNAYFVVVGSCAGDGIEELKLRSLTKELGLEDCLLFLGERRDVYQLLPAFDVGVLTSCSESFSNSLVEYVSVGLPVVTTDVGGAREIVADGINGFVVPINDHILLAKSIVNIANGLLNKHDIGITQQKALEMFSLKEIITSYQKIYLEELI